jgi:hypothetical protein
MGSIANTVHREPWNKGKIVGQKAPFKLKDIWALRVRLQMEGRARELALFNLGIDSKLRGCERVGFAIAKPKAKRSAGLPVSSARGRLGAQAEGQLLGGASTSRTRPATDRRRRLLSGRQS